MKRLISILFFLFFSFGSPLLAFEDSSVVNELHSLDQESECGVTPPFFRAGNSYSIASFAVKVETCELRGGAPTLSLRSFSIGDQAYRWMAHSNNLNTFIVPERCLSSCKGEPPAISGEKTRLSKIFSDLQVFGPNNSVAGKSRSILKRSQIFLTVDLCPSHKPLVRELFEKIQKHESAFGTDQPTPVAIAISGNWRLHHDRDFKFLIEQEHKKRIKISWVNHTMNHPYVHGVENQRNFLNLATTNVESEILENEVLLLKNGIVPSLFFRFPGLVSNPQLHQKIIAYGLIPLGSDSWLALGQKIQNGSVVLVHGNGNEPKGIQLLFQFLNQYPKMNSLWSSIEHLFY